MNRNTLRSPGPATGDYEIDRQRHIRAGRRRMDLEVDRLTQPLESQLELQGQRLRRLLSYARVHSPWHASRLEGLPIEEFSGRDLSAIPAMTKEDLMRHWDRIVCDRRLDLDLANAHLERVVKDGRNAYLLDHYHVVASGGSTGRRAVMVWDFEGFLYHRLAYARIVRWRARQAPARRGARSPVLVMLFADNPVHISAALARCFETQRFPHAIYSASQPLTELVARLNALQPTHMATYPSMLQALAKETQGGRLKLSLRRLTTNGEPLLPETRDLAQRVFGLRVDDSWGTTESAPLAHSDGVHDGLVVNEDLNIVEPVDAQNRPVPPGQRAAKVLITNLVNLVLPVIRYEVTDEVTFLPGPNPGPLSGRRIASIEGRRDEWFTYSDGSNLHPFAFREVLGTLSAVDEYQVRQTETGAEIAVCASGELDLASMERQLSQVLENAGLEAPQISARRVSRIERHPQTGKLRRFIPLPASSPTD